MPRATKPTDEEKRALFEAAQARRKKRRLAALHKGKCGRCHKSPPRAEGQFYCMPCHLEYEKINRARRRVARKRKERATRVAVRELGAKKKAALAAGANPAHLEYLVN